MIIQRKVNAITAMALLQVEQAQIAKKYLGAAPVKLTATAVSSCERQRRFAAMLQNRHEFHAISEDLITPDVERIPNLDAFEMLSFVILVVRA